MIRSAAGCPIRSCSDETRRRGCHGAIEVQEKVRREAGATPDASDAARRRGATEAALAAFAHDIRTALTGILALGELLASSNLGERERRWAAGIKTSAEHLAALTDAGRSMPPKPMPAR